jgi:hypothetical protein
MQTYAMSKSRSAESSWRSGPYNKKYSRKMPRRVIPQRAGNSDKISELPARMLGANQADKIFTLLGQ